MHAASSLIGLDAFSFLPSATSRHEVTDVIMDDIKTSYMTQCQSSAWEGCQVGFAPYYYDALAAIAKMFHQWIYDQGNDLGMLKDNSTAVKSLHSAFSALSFLGITGTVEFFSETAMDCERK